MSALSALSAPVDTLSAAAGATSAKELAKRGEIQATSQKFEASFLSVMMQSMFQGVKTPEPFGGGSAEDQFRSLLTEAMAKEVTQAGGVGLASSVQREMLKLQGLKD